MSDKEVQDIQESTAVASAVETVVSSASRPINRTGFLKKSLPARPFINAETGALTVFYGQQPEETEFEIIDDE